ncbi:hypothetical protein PHYBOEH_001400 [Phytophthora boehmeriae]|uniref:RxLR effector protein n=1 Tax=Phytophthora boehmeriae TaxID=109152 RepID=A0A8T1XAR9_9STRA|nr:hypothetical protein PHYBOEH_001400 [Phytophthora boehmeriae]
MSDAEDVCGCLACAVLCGVCCVAAAEEDKRERERAEIAAQQLKNPNVVLVNPVAVATPFSQQKEAQMQTPPTQKEFQAHDVRTETTQEETEAILESPVKSKKKKTKRGKDGGSHKRKTGSKHRREPPPY